MEVNNEVTEAHAVAILKQWEEEHQNPNYDPIPLLTKLAEVIEVETENYMKMDPDPFDERHPSRADPNCTLGHMLKMLFRKDSFMNKLVSDYLRDNYYSRLGITNKDVRKLNVAACRLMLDIMPGLETSAVFESPTSDALVNRLFSWAEKSSEPLQTYATGLLAAAMEVQDIAASFREQNGKLVPLMLERLHFLQAQANDERISNSIRPFAHLGNTTLNDSHEPANNRRKGLRSRTTKAYHVVQANLSPPPLDETASEPPMPPKINGFMRRSSDSDVTESRRRTVEAGGDTSNSKLMSPPPSKPSPFQASDCSNSSWTEMETFVIGSVQMHPPTLATRQMFILRYLTPMGEYQEFLSHVFEKSALELILHLINLREIKNSRLAFEAMKYLAALLCHKKFSIEFINMNGLQCLLEVPRPSIAATGVSICLYYLAYCEDAMERVCLLPKSILTDLVRYALWLLECSHDSGRCNATMFFGLSFQFRIILEEFDMQDGLRKLYNVMSTLPILTVEDDVSLNEDEECSARQIVRHVCVALKRYLEAHLYIRSEQIRRTHLRENGGETAKYHSTLPSYKAFKSSPEEVQEQINTLLELMPYRAPWAPVDDLSDLGGITLLLQVIAFAYEWNYSGRAETVRSALEVLGICAIMPRVQLLLCERVDLPDEAMTVGLNVILGAAEGEIVADPDVQRAALGVLITSICSPIQRVGGPIARYYSGPVKKKTPNVRGSEEVIERLWECVRSNNGIMVLLTLMTVKTPITDADSIRGLACRVLAGLARSETVRQIISKLPLFTNGQLQNLMRDPILQDKRQEHVRFQKYALDLLERVSGKSKPNDNGLEVSLTNIHRANIIAQTHIQFNERQLFQLMQQHLLSHGMTESATALQREAGLPPIKPSTTTPIPSPFYLHQRAITPNRVRSPFVTDPHVSQRSGNLTTQPVSDLALPSNGPLAAGFSVRGGASTPSCNTPIRLSLTSNRKTELRFNNTPSRSLEKQISFDPVAHQSTMPLLKECHVTLDSIITEYLTNQHALCKNPMVTCPQFNLFIPHKCPDPKAKNSAAGNFVTRLMRGTRSRRLDQRLVHSRFYPVRTFRLSEDDAFFTCCEFINSDKTILVGTHQGEVKLFSLQTGAEETTFQCHESYISGLEASRDSKLLLSSSTWRRPLSALWSIGSVFEMKLAMDAEEHVEFSKLNQDSIIGTKGEIATIYDIATGREMLCLTPTLSNQYSKNRATFCPTDELVLSDGVLWDVYSGKQIHKFDKLNQTLSGVFHPNGLEVVSNTEVWDLRTFHLLRTVPALDMSDVLFSASGEIIYTVAVEQEIDDDTPHESSFKTLDAFDYSSIATIDVKKNIYDLACNRHDTQIAVVENQGMFDSVQESIVRLYDVGRRRDDEDEGEEEEDEEDMDGSDDGSNSLSTTEDDQNDDNPIGDIVVDGSDNGEEIIIGDDDVEDEEDLDVDNDEGEEVDENDDGSDNPIVISYSDTSDSGSDFGYE